MKNPKPVSSMYTRLLLIVIPFAALGSPSVASEPISFTATIAPLLKTHCLTCHDSELAEADYRVDTYQHLMKGVNGADVVVPEQPDKSRLYLVLVETDEDERMPAESDPLPATTIALIKDWIKQGATFDGRSTNQPIVEMLPDLEHPLPPEQYPAPIPLSALALDPSQNELFVGGYHEITQWKMNGELARRFSNQGERTYSIDLHPTLPRLISASGTPGVLGEVRLFDLSSGKVMSVLTKTDEVIMDARYSPDGKTIAVAMPDGSTRLLDSETGQEKNNLPGHSDQVLAIRWHQNGQFLATASRDHTAKIFDTVSGASIATFTGHTKAVNDVAFLNGDEAVSVSNDGTAQLWNIRNGKRIREIASTKKPLISIACSPEKFAISGAISTQYFRTNGTQPLEKISNSDAWTTIAAFDATGKIFVSGTQSGEVFIHSDQNEPSRFKAIPGH